MPTSGGKLELLVERVLQNHEVVAHMKVSKKPQAGALLDMAGGFQAELLGRWPDEHGALFRLRFSGEPHALMAAHGHEKDLAAQAKGWCRGNHARNCLQLYRQGVGFYSVGDRVAINRRCRNGCRLTCLCA